jgi:uncharacterized membrane protein
MRYVVAYIAAAIVFLAMDAAWLTVMGARLYKPALGSLMLDKPSIAPAALFYIVYIFGVIYFCVAPALRTGRWSTAATNAMVLGLCAYATYDLTNQATLRIWSVRVTVSDLVWGMIVTTSAASAGFFASRWIVKGAGG